ncbi:hypothetical protein BU17DRAFT_80839 [Hysterangium stoloniferum]|nr:hypothetical protein BU17DRAFT_80839 [Hysterangium stoloniferum]
MSQARPQQPKPSSRSQRPEVATMRPPKAVVARLFWRWKLWIGGTFVTAMLEPWETFFLFSVMFLFFFVLVGGIYRYLPSQAVFLSNRLQYYLVGTDGSTNAGSAVYRAAEL